MLYRLGKQQGIETVCIVRKKEQEQVLKSMGVLYVLNQESPSFETDLSSLCQKFNIALAFDAVGGPLSGKVLNCLLPKGECLVYGGLSDTPCGELDLTQLVHNVSLLLITIYYNLL